jgi:hypothetical protein
LVNASESHLRLYYFCAKIGQWRKNVILSQFTRSLDAEQPLPAFHRFLHDDVNVLGEQRKKRWIYAPNENMRLIHGRLIKYLRQTRPALPHSTCGEKGDKSYLNIMRHRGNRWLYMTDIQSAYSNVQAGSLAAVLADSYPELAHDNLGLISFLSEFCLHAQGGLITGANASVLLFNLYAGLLVDLELSEYCRARHMTYSRYLDDLTFSSPGAPIGTTKRKQILAIIRAAGLPINEKKTHGTDLIKGPVMVNGLRADITGRIFLPRHYLLKLRGMMHRCMNRCDVKPSRVHGRMGLFWQSTQGRSYHQMARIEQRLVDQYREFRRFERSMPAWPWDVQYKDLDGQQQEMLLR